MQAGGGGQVGRSAAKLAIHVEHQSITVLPGLAMIATSDQLPRERAGLKTTMFGVANGSRPAVFAISIDVVFRDWHRRPVEWVDIVPFVVPRALHVLADIALIHQLERAAGTVERPRFHDHGAVAAFNRGVVVTVFMREIAPR